MSSPPRSCGDASPQPSGPDARGRVYGRVRRAAPPARRDGNGLIDVFARFARRMSSVARSPWAFLGAGGVIVVWGFSGPVFGFSDTWQLVINTGTTIVTFLMVFLIQNTQNRDSQALHLKLDALIDAIGDAREDMVDIEDASTAEIDAAREEFKRLREVEQSLHPHAD